MLLAGEVGKRRFILHSSSTRPETCSLSVPTTWKASIQAAEGKDEPRRLAVLTSQHPGDRLALSLLAVYILSGQLIVKAIHKG